MKRLAMLRSGRVWRQIDPFVLLVDDHPGCLDRLTRLLEIRGYRCVAVASASEAIAFCDKVCPGLVVTDLHMPEIDGRGFAGWLKTRHPSTPIVLLTSECFDQESEEALQQSFSAILSKPVDVERLLRLLSDLCPTGVRSPRA